MDNNTWDLSVKNPHKKGDNALRDPQEIIKEINLLDIETSKILDSLRGKV